MTTLLHELERTGGRYGLQTMCEGGGRPTSPSSSVSRDGWHRSTRQRNKDHEDRIADNTLGPLPNPCDAFQATVSTKGDALALRTLDGSVSFTWASYGERVRAVAAGLAGLGVARGDCVAIISTNRPEFHIVDTAAFHLGATPFSIYATSSPEQIAYLLEDSGAKVVIAESPFRSAIDAAVAVGASPDHILTLEDLDAIAGFAERDFDFRATWQAIEPEDILTLIYTSGTTGPPKGVELTHANLLAQDRGVFSVLDIPDPMLGTSYLPNAHIVDRWAFHYTGIIHGAEIVCIPDPRQIAGALPVVRPTVWGAVPRVVEKLKAALEAGIAAEPDEDKRAAIEGAARRWPSRRCAWNRPENRSPRTWPPNTHGWTTSCCPSCAPDRPRPLRVGHHRRVPDPSPRSSSSSRRSASRSPRSTACPSWRA